MPDSFHVTAQPVAGADRPLAVAIGFPRRRRGGGTAAALGNKQMTAIDIRTRRTRYAYPAVGLRSGVHVSFPSTLALDHYHCELLTARSDVRRVQGYLSVVYWGHYSGQAGIVRARRALSKVRMAMHGKNYYKAGSILKKLSGMLRRRQVADAVMCATELPQVGFAFASKLCAFLDPGQCGVIDSVIAKRYPKFGFKLRGRYVETSRANGFRYAEFCKYLSKRARKMNVHGRNLFWRDRDGALHHWRAVDVERALY